MLPLHNSPMQRYYYIPFFCDVKKFFKFFKISLDFLFDVWYIIFTVWGRSSAGRALEWHSRGQEFDPLRLHQKKTYALIQSIGLFQRNKSLAGFVKYASRVKYCFAKRNACERGWIYFISLDASVSNFTIYKVNYFTFAARQIFHSLQIVKPQIIVKFQPYCSQKNTA